MEKNFIVNTSFRNNTMLTWNNLHSANFSFDRPFCLQLSNNEILYVEKVIRIIPKKRMVVAGVWREQTVVAKLFLHKKRAKQYLEKDVEGIQSLQNNKIPTPELLHIGKTSDGRIQLLILEYVKNAQNLAQIFEAKNQFDAELLSVLKALSIELATQHVLGLLQHDLHLKNFLFTKKKIYTLDGAQFERFSHLIPKDKSMNNLALFLSQLGVNAEEYQEILFKYYAEARGWRLKDEDKIELFNLINKWTAIRWKKFSKKIIRDSSQFTCIKNGSYRGMYDKKYVNHDLLKFLSQPEILFERVDKELLKNGRSTTVLLVNLDNKKYVIKRYNLKNKWHALRRCLRATRADCCWRIAQKLNLFGIATAKPVAFIEKRWLNLRAQSYYVMEYVSNESAADYLRKHTADNNKQIRMIKKISALLQSMVKVEITHGDLKISNVLIDGNENPVLIDLDGASEYVSLSGLRKAWTKELDRFLENFADNIEIRKQFEFEFEGWR